MRDKGSSLLISSVKWSCLYVRIYRLVVEAGIEDLIDSFGTFCAQDNLVTLFEIISQGAFQTYNAIFTEANVKTNYCYRVSLKFRDVGRIRIQFIEAVETICYTSSRFKFAY